MNGPLLTDDDHTMVFISSAPQQSPLPAIMKVNGDNKFQLFDLVPSDFPKDKLITQAGHFTAPDGVTVHADLFMPEEVLLKARYRLYPWWSSTTDVARLALF